MKHLTRFLTLLSVTVACTSGILAKNIGPGSPAPLLQIQRWFKGLPVTKLEANKTYVIEFWATWCGPCIQSMPHLSDLARKNTDVTFIAVSIWEDDVDDKIAKFVDEMGDKMDFNVAYSGNKTGMAQSWMEAAGRNGIPSSFVVKNGVIQWIGHPMSLDKPLAEIKAGTFDVNAFRTSYEKEADANRKRAAVNKELSSIQALFDSGKHDEAKKKLEEFEKNHADMAKSADSTRFGWLAAEDFAAWMIKATEYMKGKDVSKKQQVLSYVLRQAGKGGDIAKGRKAIEMAISETEGKDILVLQYANQFYGQLKEYRTQLEVLNKIADALPGSAMKDNADFKAWLDKTKKDVEAKLNGS